MDENLNKVKEVKFTDAKTVELQESAFNGTDLIFKFFDEEQKIIDFRVYGFDGKQKFNYQREVDKKTKKVHGANGDVPQEWRRRTKLSLLLQTEVIFL